MASPRSVASVGEYLAVLNEPAQRLGLHGTPVSPWYIGQPDLNGTLVPALYKSKIDPALEREMLRDFRMMGQEMMPLKGTLETDIMWNAHANGLPLRVMEWAANPLAALFLAIESLGGADGRVWILNPWVLNHLTGDLTYVPMVDSPYFAKYVVKLDDPDAPPLPAAVQPMAFRPYRTARHFNTQNTYITVHGKSPAALEDLTFFLKRADAFLTYVVIEAAAKKRMMKQLHDMGVTRFMLFPGLSSLTRTLAYRYSADYLQP